MHKVKKSLLVMNNNIYLLFLGPINISTTAILVSPGIAVSGTISITSSEVYFEVDEDHEEFKKIDPQVGRTSIFFFLCCWE